MLTSLRIVPVLLGSLFSLLAAGLLRAADESIPAARRTETVALIERCLPSVVSILAEVANAQGVLEGRVGSGSIIHPAGFVLTNEHVVRGFRNGGVLLSDGTLVPMRVIAVFSHDDLAIVQLRVSQPLTPIRLGRSHDVLLGEPTLVIGSPGGLVHSVSTGIVSGINRSTRNESNFLPWMIQTNAAVSRGNSGGPLINALGEQIGVISTIGGDLQNVSFAIAIDHVRKVLPPMLSMEQRRNLWLGIECDPLADDAVIKKVTPASPAARAGLQLGDVLQRVNTFELDRGVDLELALVSHGPGDTLELKYVRDGQERSCDIALQPLPLAEPVPAEGKQPGLEYSIYTGEWSQLPDFTALTPERTGQASAIDPAAIKAPVENAGLVYRGYLKVPADDLYAFYTTSDDGSRLWIGDELVVDNDGLHPGRETGGILRLRAGLHPIRIEYFERSGAEVLGVRWESATFPKVAIPPGVLFRDPAEGEASSGAESPRPGEASKSPRAGMPRED